MPLSAPERILRIIQKAIGLRLLSTPESILGMVAANRRLKFVIDGWSVRCLLAFGHNPEGHWPDASFDSGKHSADRCCK